MFGRQFVQPVPSPSTARIECESSSHGISYLESFILFRCFPPVGKIVITLQLMKQIAYYAVMLTRINKTMLDTTPKMPTTAKQMRITAQVVPPMTARPLERTSISLLQEFS
jgi:hypothetical protein